MKITNLNLGRALSREEQKQIKGGTNMCSAGEQVSCVCVDGSIICLTSEGTESAPLVCNAAGVCASHGGFTSGGCGPTCTPKS